MFSDDEAQSDANANANADADTFPKAADADDKAEEDSDADVNVNADANVNVDANANDEAKEDSPNTDANADAKPKDDIPIDDADQFTMLGQPTASYAAMLWEGEDHAPDNVDQSTVFQAALAWQGNDTSLSSSHTGSPNAFDAATFCLADSISASPSPPASPILTTFPTAYNAADVADVFLSSSETDSPGSNADSVEDSFRAESPSTSQIENPASLLIYSHADFSYIDDTWLSGSDDMMDTSDME